MKNKLKIALIGVSLVVGTTTTFVFLVARNYTQRQEAAMALISEMDGIDQQLSQASAEFGFALRDFLKNGESSRLQTIQQAHRTLAQSVNRAISVVSNQAAPESEHGAGYISAQRKFLLVQRKIIRVDFARLLELLEDASSPAATQYDAIEAIVDGAYAETEKEFSLVHAAREKFADEFAIHLSTR